MTSRKEKTKSSEMLYLNIKKRIVGMIEGRKGRYHADPGFHRLGILKIEDLYRQQLRVYAWQFSKNLLPESQAAMLHKVKDSHKYSTRASEKGLLRYTTEDQRSIGYRVPREWQSTPSEVRQAKTLQGTKNRSKKGFLSEYGSFICEESDCYVCGCDAEGASGW